MICASEDVGNADPQALCVAVSASLAVERVGMPEAQIILANAATYVASAPKSNSAVKAIEAAMNAVKTRLWVRFLRIFRTATTAVPPLWDGGLIISMP
mgnify:CR=1 FL=1